ncbi:MAG: riboflavin kinase [Clostridium sp.]
METPTANIYPDAYKVLPPYGVYAVIVDVEGKKI